MRFVAALGGFVGVPSDGLPGFWVVWLGLNKLFVLCAFREFIQGYMLGVWLVVGFGRGFGVWCDEGVFVFWCLVGGELFICSKNGVIVHQNNSE